MIVTVLSLMKTQGLKHQLPFQVALLMVFTHSKHPSSLGQALSVGWGDEISVNSAPTPQSVPAELGGAGTN